MIPIKIADLIIKFLLVVALLLIATRVTACEIYNYETKKIERCEDQNISLNAQWKEFYVKDLK